MDRSQWSLLIRLIRRAVREVGPSKRVAFSDELILKMYFWSVMHDRPLCWASDPAHYQCGWFRPRTLPSNSQFCRRVQTPRFQQFLGHIHHAQTHQAAVTSINYADGKPLAVGNFSRDPDATAGYGVGRVERGYKLHALVTHDRIIARWSLMPLHVHELHAAHKLIDAGPIPKDAVVLADGNYDAHRLHKHLGRRGGWLWTKPRGMAEHPVTRRQMGAKRRALLEVWRQTPAWAARFYHQRLNVEGTFSNLTSRGGGLGPLPGFVRRLTRVRRWVGAKIVLYHLHLAQRLTAHA